MYKTALKVLEKINSSGFKAYIVGGYPRDLYLNRKSVDIDICTNALPKDLKLIFKSSNISNKEYGSVSLILNNIRFEITTFRKEIKYENNRFPVKIEYIDSLIDDLKRRDFTINTLCINSKGELLDLLDSKKDIDNKIIKCVGSSDDKIKEDILRSLRAIRFATILNFSLDDELKKSIKKYAYLLNNLSYYRKKEELEKIFSNPNCKYGLRLIKELELDKFLELQNIDNIKITSSILGIWAQLNVKDIYNFSNYEKDIIEKINLALKEDIMDKNVIYKYGLYISTLVGEIKGIDRKKIVSIRNNLPILNIKDIDITSQEICNILNQKPGKFLKDIYKDLEYKIINDKISNKKEEIIRYLKKGEIV